MPDQIRRVHVCMYSKVHVEMRPTTSEVIVIAVYGEAQLHLLINTLRSKAL